MDSLLIKKNCKKCNEAKQLISFHKKPRGKYGRDSTCIDCICKYKKKLYKIKHNRKNKVLTILNDNEFVMSEKQILNFWKEIE